jgi:hypothetical protein
MIEHEEFLKRLARNAPMGRLFDMPATWRSALPPKDFNC